MQILERETKKTMLCVIIALMPALIMAVYNFGARAFILTLVCVAASVLFEFLFEKITKRENTVSDLSAIVTGLLLAYNLPPTFPYWMAIIGCFVAIVIVKQLFGGIGQNFANPAITARIVLLVSFSTDMAVWAKPQERFLSAADAVTGATPLTQFAEGSTDSLPSNMEMFIGTIGGSLGEISAAALLIGAVILLVTRVISPAIPVAYIGTVFVFTWALGLDPVFHILAGGVMLGAIFMATDPTTSPKTTVGKIIFGIGCGLLTVVIRVYGTYPEGVSFAILLMNILTPHIDSLTMRKPKAEKGGAN
ncbi:MAG: Na+-transporting NADH:ubiquinone oxidoreductase subunit D [Eubacteriales Family XIII. Incertae Sedis bacterium]|jgi:Na+-translocating ferredoxin:NAD+ oxidoreductase subunit D|nr:MAG: Na+-transporting NADH:ubiquinone oxidoreductase subunit D [Clostridiales Family XIII bacterium]PWM69175.1 MAG: Na+-transporting NADH:ubiquinone oxidoreductase subunit D [Clostridiales Family XIII bacterium]